MLPRWSVGQITMDKAPGLKNIDVEEHPGEKIPLDLTFVNEAGDTVKLADYFIPGRPVLLTLAYYRCPMLCGLVIEGLSKGISKSGLFARQRISDGHGQYKSGRVVYAGGGEEKKRAERD